MAVSRDSRIKNKNKQWYFQVIVSTNPIKRKTFRGFRTKKDAQKAEIEWLEQHKYDAYDTEQFETFDEVIDLYLEHCKSVRENGTYKNYDSLHRNHLELFKGKKITKLTPVLINAWYEEHAKTLSPAVLNNCRKLLKGAFNHSIKLKKVTGNPFDLLPYTPEPVKIRNRFTLAEMKKLMELCRRQVPEYYLMFVLSACTGLRCSELLGLTKDDINLKKEQIYITKQYYRGELKKTKTVGSTRIIDFSNTVKEAIEFHYRRYGIFQGWVFPSDDKPGFPLSYRAVGRRFEKLLKIAGYPKEFMRVHDLRGQFVDIMHSQNIPTKQISKLVGHSSTRITNDVYSQILQDTTIATKYAVDRALEV